MAQKFRKQEDKGRTGDMCIVAASIFWLGMKKIVEQRTVALYPINLQ